MPSRPSTFGIAGLLLLITLTTGCWKDLIDPFGLIFDGGGEEEDVRPSVLPNRVINPVEKFSLAIGGMAPGRDELVILDGSGDPRDFSGSTLECEAEENLVSLKPRTGYSTEAEGSGVRIVPLKAGVTGITCTLDGVAIDEAWEVTIPPQLFIQILVAEAMGQLSDEAQLDEDEEDLVVLPDSVSPTGSALGSVIRNRIAQINMHDNPGLFMANEEFYDEDPQESYYEAVILAEGQFSPTDPGDPNYILFLAAANRSALDDEEKVAYDQAVITAAGIFNGDIADNTTGAFAFRSPTPSEWDAIAQGWSMHYMEIPEGAGWSDSDFPAFDPIQILIHPDVWKYDDGRSSFVFARMRTDEDFAIVNIP